MNIDFLISTIFLQGGYPKQGMITCSVSLYLCNIVFVCTCKMCVVVYICACKSWNWGAPHRSRNFELIWYNHNNWVFSVIWELDHCRCSVDHPVVLYDMILCDLRVIPLYMLCWSPCFVWYDFPIVDHGSKGHIGKGGVDCSHYGPMAVIFQVFLGNSLDSMKTGKIWL